VLYCFVLSVNDDDDDDDFAEKLFRKLCTKFHKNRLSIIKDITEAFFFANTMYAEIILAPVLHGCCSEAVAAAGAKASAAKVVGRC